MTKRMWISVVAVLMMCLCACSGQQGSVDHGPAPDAPGGNNAGTSLETEYQ